MKKMKWAMAIILLIAGTIFLFQNNQSQTETTYPTGLHKKLAKGHFALYNAELEYLKTRNPVTGKIPENIRANELKFVQEMSGTLKSRGSQEWTARGPNNVGGRMLCIAIDMMDETHMLAGSASGGMWRSTNSGASWEKVTPAIGEQSATCLSQDKREGKTDTWYYGTGEILNTTNRNVSTNVRTIGVGNGIFKSTDIGLHSQLRRSDFLVCNSQIYIIYLIGTHKVYYN